MNLSHFLSYQSQTEGRQTERHYMIMITIMIMVWLWFLLLPLTYNSFLFSYILLYSLLFSYLIFIAFHPFTSLLNTQSCTQNKFEGKQADEQTNRQRDITLHDAMYSQSCSCRKNEKYLFILSSVTFCYTIVIKPPPPSPHLDPYFLFPDHWYHTIQSN